MTTRTRDIAWVAGILEGEATFTLSGRRKRPTIVLKMTDEDVVQRVARIIGCRTVGSCGPCLPLGRKRQHYLQLRCSPAIQWMMTILPLLGMRRATRVKEIIAYWRAEPIESEKRRAAHLAVWQRPGERERRSPAIKRGIAEAKRRRQMEQANV